MPISAEVLEKSKLSTIPPGHWRCKWRRLPGFIYLFPVDALQLELPGTIIVDDATWISVPRFLSRERADEDGRKWATFCIEYVEAVYFPGEAP